MAKLPPSVEVTTYSSVGEMALPLTDLVRSLFSARLPHSSQLNGSSFWMLGTPSVEEPSHQMTLKQMTATPSVLPVVSVLRTSRSLCAMHQPGWATALPVGSLKTPAKQCSVRLVPPQSFVTITTCSLPSGLRLITTSALTP